MKIFYFKLLEFYEFFYYILLEFCKFYEILECLDYKNLLFECVFYGDVFFLRRFICFEKICGGKENFLRYVLQ